MSLLGNALLGAIGGGAKSFADQIRLEAQQAREDRLKDEELTHQSERDEKQRKHQLDLEGIRAANNNATTSLRQSLSDESAKKNRDTYTSGKDELGHYQQSKNTGKKEYFRTKGDGSGDLLKLKEQQSKAIDSKIGDFQAQLDNPELAPEKRTAIQESIAALRNDQRVIWGMEPLPFGTQERTETEQEEEPGLLGKAASAVKDFVFPDPQELPSAKELPPENEKPGSSIYDDIKHGFNKWFGESEDGMLNELDSAIQSAQNPESRKQSLFKIEGILRSPSFRLLDKYKQKQYFEIFSKLKAGQ